MFNRSMRTAMFGGASAAALGLALAAASGAPAMAQEEPLVQDRVLVTGSRIARRDFQANSPIVTVDEASFENRSSFSVEATLNQLPQFTPGQSQNLFSGAGSPFVDAVAAPGAATLNLRGLGANRNLVLVNGRRPQPVNAQLVTDVNTIPSAAIQSVEVITGGAAAVYGSDAIAGVVNFILKDNFEGMEVDVQYGIAEVGDNEQTTVSLLLGGNFANGRGNAMVGGQWSERGVSYQREREFYTRAWNDPLTNGGGLNNSRPAVTQTTIGPITYGINPNGTLFNVLQANNPTPPAGVPAANWSTAQWPLNGLAEGAGFHQDRASPGTTFGALTYNDPDNQISIPLTRYSAFSSGHYDLTDSVTAFFEANYTHTYTSALSLVPPAFNFWALSVPYSPANDDPDSPTFGANQNNFHPVPRQLADLLNNRALPGGAPGSAAGNNWTLVRSLDFLGRLRTDTTSNIFQLTSGLEGDLPIRDWTWEVFGSHGETNVLAQQLSGNISQENLQQILTGYATSVVNGVQTPGLQTAQGPYGQGWTNAIGGSQIATIGSCTSGIPIFNADGTVPTSTISVSQDCIDYATLRTNSSTIIKQNVVEANLQGGLFDIWAGEIRFAAGLAYRDVDFQFLPDSGINANQARANVINNIALPRFAEGYTAVKEVYGELLIPLLTDVPFIQNLELELGGRLSDYNTIGTVETYKILGDWTVNDYLRFRGGYQRANRAPNVYELFAPLASSGSFSGTNDPCTNIPGFTASYGNLPDNPNRVNLQAACAELISRDGGFNYQTLATNPNPGEPPNDPGIDLTHISNFRWTVFGYNRPFPITLPLIQGNPNLQSEVADTWTAGLVISSPWDHRLLQRLSMSVDWYSIDMVDTIDTPSALLVYQQCLDPQFNPLIASAAGSVTGAAILAGNPYCDLINREPVDLGGNFAAVSSGIDRNYDARFVNLGGTQTSGVDVVINWGADFEDIGMGFVPGALNINFQANWLDYYRVSPFEGAAYVDFTGTTQGGGGFFDYKTFTNVTWVNDAWSAGLRIRYLPEMDVAPGAPAGAQGVTSHTEIDLFGRVVLSDAYELRFGVDNLLDEQPEVVGRTATNNAASSTNQNYDVLGRRFFLGATARF
jgi:outer membrane receptor protein involved in Fe transport